MIILKSIEIQKRFVLSSLMLALLSGVAYATPTRPDAGDNLREVQKQPLPLPTPSAPAPVRVEEQKSKAAASGGVKVAVKKVQVTGNAIYTSAELEALVNYLVGGEHALSDLDTAAQRITAFYRQNGYIVAHAYLPVQEVKDGLIRMEVLEGRVDKQRVENNSLLVDDRVNDYLGRVKRGDVLKAEEVDRVLLLLSDVPGVGSARAALQPGASVGTSDLVVELKPSAPYLASVDLDNYGGRYTGQYRFGASFTVNSPTGLGDSLSLRAQMSNGDLAYWKVGYQIPVGDNGIRVGGTYSDSRYGLGKEFASLGAYGSGVDFTLFGSYPFIRTQITNLTGTVTYQDKYLHDVTKVSFSEGIKHVR
jgi:hemolysin activation/secretion protein